MRRAPLALLCALAAAVAGCGHSGSGGGGGEKGGFVAAADRVCAAHLRSVMTWLDRPGSGAAWQQQAVQDEGIYEIMGRSIGRLEALGPAPGPNDAAFAGYVKTLKARASLYQLTSMAFEDRNTIFALQLEQRISSINASGDRYAHTYGLQICGTGIQDVGRAFKAAGWDPSR